MAYFPNGTAGICYIEEYCVNCVHWPRGDDDPACPIDMLHNLYNYDQCDESPRGKAIEAVLETLIPSTKDGLGAEQCSMFLVTADAEAEAAEQRRLAEQPRKYEAVMAELRAINLPTPTTRAGPFGSWGAPGTVDSPSGSGGDVSDLHNQPDRTEG